MNEIHIAQLIAEALDGRFEDGAEPTYFVSAYREPSGMVHVSIDYGTEDDVLDFVVLVAPAILAIEDESEDASNEED